MTKARWENKLYGEVLASYKISVRAVKLVRKPQLLGAQDSNGIKDQMGEEAVRGVGNQQNLR